MVEVQMQDFLILNRLVEIIPVVLGPLALIALLRAARAANQGGFSRAVRPMIAMAVTVMLFISSQVLWWLWLNTEQEPYRIMFSFVRGITGLVFMFTCIWLGQAVSRAVRAIKGQHYAIEPASVLDADDEHP